MKEKYLSMKIGCGLDEKAFTAKLQKRNDLIISLSTLTGIKTLSICCQMFLKFVISFLAENLSQDNNYKQIYKKID